MLFDLICSIMDLPDPAIEAKRKLVNTYMVVNGKVLYIKDFNYALDFALCSIDNNSTGYKVRVNTLEVWLPETGLYPLNNGQAAFVTKCPKRQWLKSFSPSYYYINFIGENIKPLDESSSYYNHIYQSKRVTIFVDSYRDIYYFNRNIGYVKDSITIVCTDSRFLQELKDWERDNG